MASNQTMRHRGEDYEVYVSRGIEAREQKDHAQWVLGLLASQVQAIYGEYRLKQFSSDINIAYSTLLGYRRVWEFYSSTTCTECFFGVSSGHQNSPGGEDLRQNPLLSYTHWKYAMRLGDLTEALSFLDECIDGAWCTDLAYSILSQRLGKPERPALVGEFSSRRAALDFLAAHTREEYIVRIYQVRELHHA